MLKKSSEKVPKLILSDPQKQAFRSRGVAKTTKSKGRRKVIKKSLKLAQMDLKSTQNGFWNRAEKHRKKHRRTVPKTIPKGDTNHSKSAPKRPLNTTQRTTRQDMTTQNSKKMKVICEQNKIKGFKTERKCQS